MKREPAMELNEIAAITDALQAQEKLHLVLKRRDTTGNVFYKSTQVLDSLREMKSELEGTQIKLRPVKVREDSLGPLKQLALMHVPHSLTSDVKAQFRQMVIDLFEGSCKKVIFGGLVTCPWYIATQEDRGQQARYNNLLIVYLNHHEQVLTPANPHLKEELCEIIDHGWFYAAEAYHFAHYVLKGKSRFIEAFCLPDSAVFIAEPEWLKLREILEPSLACNLRGFLEQCRGQAVGSVAKKSKSGVMKLKDWATLHEFCDSFRLLFHASNILNGAKICLNSITECDSFTTTSHAEEAMDSIKALYQKSEGVSKNKHHLLEIVMKWRKVIDPLMANHQFTKPNEVNDRLRKWQLCVRTNDTNFQERSISDDGRNTVLPFMKRIGGNVSKMSPENILLIAQAGSFLYGLNTPESDVDFIVIYADPVQDVLSSCTRPDESFESRGPSKSFEFGAYEARLLSEMLWKGSVVMLELLFSDSLEYVSKDWKVLHENRQMFVTERAILQYFGLVKNNMMMIENKKHYNTPREKKLFYQIIHKLQCIEEMIEGSVPSVKCTGEKRDFIMKIRKGPLEGDLDRDRLYDMVKKKYDNAKISLAKRSTRLPENISYDFLLDWILKVRGLR